MNIDGFDWGPWMGEGHGLFHKEAITKEFELNIYEKFFEVKEGDTVLDIGASIGPFTYSILHKKPLRVICVEPSIIEHSTLEKNTQNGPVTIVKKAITPRDGDKVSTYVFEQEQITTPIEGISFQTLLKENNINQIDFLKTDCEEGEYDIFTPENLVWIKQNVKKIVGEWHLGNPESKQKFKEFRDVYLRVFPKHEICAVNGVDIKWELWTDRFIEYYEQVIIYIDNR